MAMLALASMAALGLTTSMRLRVDSLNRSSASAKASSTSGIDLFSCDQMCMQCPDGKNILIQRQKSGTGHVATVGGAVLGGVLGGGVGGVAGAVSVSQLAKCSEIGFEFWHNRIVEKDQPLRNTGFLGVFFVQSGLAKLQRAVTSKSLKKDVKALEACDSLTDPLSWHMVRAAFSNQSSHETETNLARRCLAHSDLCGSAVDAVLNVDRWNPFAGNEMCSAPKGDGQHLDNLGDATTVDTEINDAIKASAYLDGDELPDEYAQAMDQVDASSLKATTTTTATTSTTSSTTTQVRKLVWTTLGIEAMQTFPDPPDWLHKAVAGGVLTDDEQYDLESRGLTMDYLIKSIFVQAVGTPVAGEAPCPAKGEQCTLIVGFKEGADRPAIVKPYEDAQIYHLNTLGQATLDFGKTQSDRCCKAYKDLKVAPGVEIVEFDAPVSFGVPSVEPQPAEPHHDIVGGHVDEHGCRSGAGYTWCASTGKCHRPWSEDCPTELHILPVPAEPHHDIVGGHVDEHGCRSGAGYTWCASTGMCHGPSEHCPTKLHILPVPTPGASEGLRGEDALAKPLGDLEPPVPEDLADVVGKESIETNTATVLSQPESPQHYVKQPDRDAPETLKQVAKALVGKMEQDPSKSHTLSDKQMTAAITEACKSKEQKALCGKFGMGTDKAKQCKDRCCLEACKFFSGKMPSCVSHCVRS